MPELSMVTAAIGVVNKSIETVKKLRDIDLKLQAAEYKDALADLLSSMADLKVKLTEVQEENLKLQKIISGQDQKTRLREKFKLSNSHYILEEDFLSFKRGAYCAHCFEEKGELKVLSEMGIYYLCNSCKGRFQ